MLIFKDLIGEHNDEVLTDTYKFELLDDAVYKIKSKRVTESTGIDEALIGANASAEEAAEGTEDAGITNYDLVINHQLVETNFGKKDYMTYIKEYMKNIKKSLEESNPDRVPIFTKGTEKFVKEVLKGFKDYQFFMGTSCDANGIIALCKYEDDGHPYFYYFKDGLVEEKV